MTRGLTRPFLHLGTRRQRCTVYGLFLVLGNGISTLDHRVRGRAIQRNTDRSQSICETVSLPPEVSPCASSACALHYSVLRRISCRTRPAEVRVRGVILYLAPLRFAVRISTVGTCNCRSCWHLQPLAPARSLATACRHGLLGIASCVPCGEHGPDLTVRVLATAPAAVAIATRGAASGARHEV